MRKIYTIILLILVIFSSLTQAQKKHVVKVRNSGFHPVNLVVAAGDTVEWRWIEGNHSVTSDSAVGKSVWDSPLNATIRSFSRVISSKGLHRFYCRLHQGHTGIIEVKGGESILPSFDYINASIAGKNIILKWRINSEGTPDGFNIERRSGEGAWETVAFINAQNGSGRAGRSFSFTDKNVPAASQYAYRIRISNPGINTVYSEEAKISVMGPESYNLYTNYPNPFNPMTSIKYSIPERSYVSLKVYNALGLEIATLQHGEQEAGEYEVSFDGTPYPSGIYYYQLKSNSFTEVRKMTLLK